MYRGLFCTDTHIIKVSWNWIVIQRASLHRNAHYKGEQYLHASSERAILHRKTQHKGELVFNEKRNLGSELQKRNFLKLKKRKEKA